MDVFCVEIEQIMKEGIVSRADGECIPASPDGQTGVKQSMLALHVIQNDTKETAMKNNHSLT
jgi:hypothetical protein